MSLDEEFIREDVAGLSLMAYEDTIRDGNFFSGYRSHAYVLHEHVRR